MPALRLPPAPRAITGACLTAVGLAFSSWIPAGFAESIDSEPARSSQGPTPPPPPRTEESFIPNFAVGGVDYLWASDADFEGDTSGSLGFQEVGLSGNVPVWMTERIRLTLGVRYRWNGLDLDGVGLSDASLDLHRLQIPLNAWIDTEGRWRFWVRAEPGIFSDFDSIGSDDWAFSALALASYQLTDAWRVALGGYYSRDTGDDTLLPAAGFIWRPGPHWIVSLTVPRIQVAWAPNGDWLFTANAFPSGGKWNLRDAGRDLDLEYGAIRLGATAERRIGGSRFWAYLEGGLLVGQDLEVRNGGRSLVDTDLESSGYLSAGLRFRF